MARIIIRPDLAARCWTATFTEDNDQFPAGTFPLPYAINAPVQLVGAFLRERFPTAQVSGVEDRCEGCAS